LNEKKEGKGKKRGVKKYGGGGGGGGGLKPTNSTKTPFPLSNGGLGSALNTHPGPHLNGVNTFYLEKHLFEKKLLIFKKN